MEILRIIEHLQFYPENVVAYKLDGCFAHAVTEAAELLVKQGERIADLENAQGNVVVVDGYRAFRGIMQISWRARPAEEIEAHWLYRPDTGYWYGNGRSFPKEICTILKVLP